MFQILAFPVPLNDTSSQATHLVDLPEILAVTGDLTYYTTLTEQELNKCVRITCRFSKVLKPFTHNSCILALFKNDKGLIKKQCNFRVSLDHISTQVKEISKTAILVYKTKHLEFDCETGKKWYNGVIFAY